MLTGKLGQGSGLLGQCRPGHVQHLYVYHLGRLCAVCSGPIVSGQKKHGERALHGVGKVSAEERTRKKGYIVAMGGRALPEVPRAIYGDSRSSKVKDVFLQKGSQRQTCQDGFWGVCARRGLDHLGSATATNARSALCKGANPPWPWQDTGTRLEGKRGVLVAKGKK